MKYTIPELAFILYNNRSIECVSNFLEDDINPHYLVKIEKKFDWCKGLFENVDKQIEINASQLDMNGEDIIITPVDIESLTSKFKEKSGKLSDNERNYLHQRNITDEVIERFHITGLSQFTDENDLRIIGARCHPVLSPVISDGIEEGGIIIPLFENDTFKNCAIRKLSDIGKLKYTLAVPDVPVWGLHDVEKGDEIYITEGIFDMIALRERGVKAVTVSSAMWSGIQLYKLIIKRPGHINIIADNDKVGYKVAITLQKFFNLEKISNSILCSNDHKDMAEHIFENNKSIDELKEIHITREMIETKEDMSFDFLKYLQTRTF